MRRLVAALWLWAAAPLNEETYTWGEAWRIAGIWRRARMGQFRSVRPVSRSSVRGTTTR